jgi:hypothetical protein
MMPVSTMPDLALNGIAPEDGASFVSNGGQDGSR